jgi:hypothetical protein
MAILRRHRWRGVPHVVPPACMFDGLTVGQVYWLEPIVHGLARRPVRLWEVARGGPTVVVSDATYQAARRLAVYAYRLYPMTPEEQASYQLTGAAGL